ncbi:MAG: hypothetical protein GKS01_05770 [Alphaproteobacteria bacterium]|nr:hypothetical protein [Alphaproteobacteria bacterium]
MAGLEMAFFNKLVRYSAMKLDQLRKRSIIFRKPLVIARNVNKWLNRRRPNAARGLNETLRPVYDEIQKTGFAPADQLVDQHILKKLQQNANERLASFHQAAATPTSTRKDFWRMILTPEDLRESSPVVQYAMTPDILELVTAYLGSIPYLSRLELVVSQPSEKDRWKVSQLWHKDFNDARMVKLFTYLSDVENEQQGPFTFLPADKHDPKVSMFPIHKPDSLLSQNRDLTKKRMILGAKGTSFLIDTHRCFHCGSRILDDSHRVAFIATYTTAAPYYRYDNEIILDGIENAEQRAVLRT